MEVLIKLFGSAARVKILRLFLLNPGHCYLAREVATRAKVQQQAVRRELQLLGKLGIIKQRVCVRNKQTKTQNGRVPRKRIRGWMLNDRFAQLQPLRAFVLHTIPAEGRTLMRRLRHTGILKLVAIAGVFIDNNESRVDLLIVGDRINKRQLESAIKSIEADVGKELAYTVFSTEEFLYRLEMRDKLVRDILDYPHEILANRIEQSIDAVEAGQ